ncbi:MAG: PilZ domain-containing protein [Myxococcales bacterium]|nr:PilZ domain-containing protein [Myxococcales bacterium]
MAHPKRDGGRHFRGVARPGRRAEVRYRSVDAHGSGPEQVAETHNIGIGGAFVVTPDPEPPGTILAVVITVPFSGRSISVRGEVRWIADGDDDPLHGMGVRFLGLQPDEVLALNDYFASLTETLDHDGVD